MTRRTERIRSSITNRVNLARRNGLEFIDITSTEIATELGINERFPSICQAMNTHILEREANVTVELINPPPSNTTSNMIFRYHIVV